MGSLETAPLRGSQSNFVGPFYQKNICAHVTLKVISTCFIGKKGLRGEEEDDHHPTNLLIKLRKMT